MCARGTSRSSIVVRRSKSGTAAAAPDVRREHGREGWYSAPLSEPSRELTMETVHVSLAPASRAITHSTKCWLASTSTHVGDPPAPPATVPRAAGELGGGSAPSRSLAPTSPNLAFTASRTALRASAAADLVAPAATSSITLDADAATHFAKSCTPPLAIAPLSWFCSTSYSLARAAVPSGRRQQIGTTAAVPAGSARSVLTTLSSTCDIAAAPKAPRGGIERSRSRVRSSARCAAVQPTGGAGAAAIVPRAAHT